MLKKNAQTEQFQELETTQHKEEREVKLKEYGQRREKELEEIESKRKENDDPSRIHFGRTDQERDYARILYSSSFRRLQGKIQLFIPQCNRFNRNRLTHSLEVAQISRVIATKLGLKDTLTVQSCALAHDIGHPPFGHAGEKVLNSLSKDNIRFEGNAQTFRVIDHLEEKHHGYNGLNLTYRTLLGTVKYYQNYSMNQHKFLYNEDYIKVKGIVESYDLELKTIDAEIMDIADEIAYAAHDLEDALSLKWFTIDELLYEFKESDYKNAYELFLDIVNKARGFAQKAETYKTSEEYSIYFKKELTSIIVNELVSNLRIKENKLAYGENYDFLAEGLKKLTYRAVSRSSENKLYELKGEKIIKGLYEVYMNKEFNEELQLLPAEYRYAEKEEREKNWERTVIDYISGMMDQYAITKYCEFFGKNALDKIY